MFVKLGLINFSCTFIVDVLHGFSISQLQHSETKGVHIFFVLRVVEVQVFFFQVLVHGRRLIDATFSCQEFVVLVCKDLLWIKGVLRLVYKFGKLLIRIVGNHLRFDVSVSHVSLLEITVGIDLLIKDVG